MSLRAVITGLLIVNLLAAQIYHGIPLGGSSIQAPQVAAALVCSIAALVLLHRGTVWTPGWRVNSSSAVGLYLTGLILLISASIFSSFNAVTLKESISYWLACIFSIVFVIFSLSGLKVRPSVPLILRWYVGFMTLFVIGAAALSYTLMGEVLAETTGRLRGLVAHSNMFAMFLVPPFSIAAMIFWQGRRVVFALCASVLFVGIVLSGSKVNIVLALLVVGGAVLLPGPKVSKRTSLKPWVVLVIGAVVSGSFLVFFSSYEGVGIGRTINQYRDIFEHGFNADTVQVRLALYSQALSLLQEFPWFGVGIRQTKHYLSTDHPHNFIIEMLVSLGLIGAIALIVWLLGIFSICWRVIFEGRDLESFSESASERGLAVGVMAFLAANLTSVSLGTGAMYFLGTLMTLLVLALERRRFLVIESKRCDSAHN